MMCLRGGEVGSAGCSGKRGLRRLWNESTDSAL